MFRSSPSRPHPAAGSRSSLTAAPRCTSSSSAGPITFVLGAERDGLPEEVVAASDELATIELPGAAESLNVAVAGAIALYERSRRG